MNRTVLMVLLLVVGCVPGVIVDEQQPPLATLGSADVTDITDNDGVSDTDPTDPPLDLEVCDGWDNDGDGAVDEDTGGDACTTEVGEGTLECVNGELTCAECLPGDSREVECGCDMNRIDHCGDAGQWLRGECNPCSTPPTPPPCELPGACRPNDEMLVRCDSACSGGDCGSDCIGALWRCTNVCEWEEISGCAPRNPECDRDVVLTEPCGMCGHQKVVCDGCFWNREPCMDEGICQAGATRVLPCPGEECAEGYAAVIECTDACVWQAPTDCDGCTPGTTETSEPCVAGYDCGVRITRTGCEETTVTICGGDSLTVGQLINSEVIRDDCSALDCVPGETGSVPCTTSAGECGGMAAPCSDSCTWGAPGIDPATGAPSECVALPGSCVPGTVQTETRSCGPGMCGASETITSTCDADGCGWGSSGSGCPACPAGDTDTRPCTTSAGQCGQQARTCTSSCAWGSWSACEPLPSACTPGATESRSCAYTCGAGTQEWQCNGCQWVPVSSCEPSDPAMCTPGAEQLQPCVPGVPACGTRGQRCTDSCTWTDVCTCAPDCGGC